MKKILLYFMVAVVLGLLLTIIPLVVLAEFEAEDRAMFFSLPSQMEKLESLGKPTYSSDGIAVLAISFMIAAVVYLSLKRRMSS